VQEQIAEQMRAKKLPMVEDVRTSPTTRTDSLVIVPRSSRVDLVELMNHLFATTDLERNYRVNLNIIAWTDAARDGLKGVLGDWLEFA